MQPDPDPVQQALRENCNEAVAVGESSGVVLRNLARLNSCVDDFDGAIAAYQQALPLWDGDEALRLELAEVCFRAKRYECARTHAESVVRQNSDSCRAFRLLSRAVEKLEGLEKAERNYSRAVQCDPTAVGFVTELGDMYFNAGIWEKAARVYRLCLEVAPRTPYCASRMGMAMRALGAEERPLIRPPMHFPAGD